MEWEKTWEPEENMSGCEESIREFFSKELGMTPSNAGVMAVEDLIEIKEVSDFCEPRNLT